MARKTQGFPADTIPVSTEETAGTAPKISHSRFSFSNPRVLEVIFDGKLI
jgi:hypothetical protein